MHNHRRLFTFLFLLPLLTISQSYGNTQKIVTLSDSTVIRHLTINPTITFKDFANYISDLFPHHSELLYIIHPNGLKIIPQPSILYKILEEGKEYLAIFRDLALKSSTFNVSLTLISNYTPIMVTQKADYMPISITLNSSNIPCAFEIGTIEVPKLGKLIFAIFIILYFSILMLIIYEQYHLCKLDKAICAFNIVNKNQIEEEIPLIPKQKITQ